MRNQSYSFKIPQALGEIKSNSEKSCSPNVIDFGDDESDIVISSITREIALNFEAKEDPYLELEECAQLKFHQCIVCLKKFRSSLLLRRHKTIHDQCENYNHFLLMKENPNKVPFLEANDYESDICISDSDRKSSRVEECKDNVNEEQKDEIELYRPWLNLVKDKNKLNTKKDRKQSASVGNLSNTDDLKSEGNKIQCTDENKDNESMSSSQMSYSSIPYMTQEVKNKFDSQSESLMLLKHSFKEKCASSDQGINECTNVIMDDAETIKSNK